MSESQDEMMQKGSKWQLYGARIFDLTVTSIDVIGPQQLATEELAIHYVQHF